MTSRRNTSRLVQGSGAHTYELVHDWGELPAHIKYGNCHGVKVDEAGFIYVHHTVHETSESQDTMVVFDPDGKFVKSWGPEFAGGAHGLHIDKEGNDEYFYFCDIQRAIVVKTTLSGEEVFTLGYPDVSEIYGRPDQNGEKITWKPTNLAVASNGDIYIGDGYGSSYIVQYDRKGEYIRTFGGPGDGPGRLQVPHGIIIDNRGGQETLLVADRSNNRLQWFTLDGEHIKFGGGVNLPCHFDIRGDELLVPDLAARVTLLDGNNDVIAHYGEGPDDWRQRRTLSRENFMVGKFVCPHGACFDREGNIFVAEWVEIGRLTKMVKVG
jgi:sugar lactone lactonase YvrE